MSGEDEETVVPNLADIVREWLRGEPTLDEHFFIHKQQDQTQVRMKCDGMRVIAGVNYLDDPEFKNKWYIGIEIIDLNPARPEFFSILEKFLRQEHNRFRKVVDKSDCSVLL